MATKSIVSPGVYTNEVDASFLAPGLGAIGAALLGRAAQGPAFVPVVVSNYSEFAGVFGDLDKNKNYDLAYAARAYLRNAGTANIVRVLGPDGRTVNGAAVNPGYSAESLWTINAFSGTIGVVMATLEITGTGASDLVVTDLGNDELFVAIGAVGVTASFLTSSANYIKKVLNTDPTKFSDEGYYVREVYDHAYKTIANGNAIYHSSSHAGVTNFAFGYNSGSTPWIKSQLFGGSTEHNLFRFHTLGHGEAENGRLKISITNIRTSAAPSVSEFGKFDVEVRDYDDTDKSRAVLENFPNVSLDPADPSYICKVIGDKYQRYDVNQDKVVDYGDYASNSRLIRVELTTGSFPDSALPWGFRGLAKPDLTVGHAGLTGSGGTTNDGLTVASGLQAIPYVQNLKDKATVSEASDTIYWGMEKDISGSVVSRFSKYATMTGSDADFTLANVSGSSVDTFTYNASNPATSKKQPGTTSSHTVLAKAVAKFTVPVAFGFDGFDRRLSNPLDNDAQLASISQLGTQALRQAIDVIKDPDFIDINLLAVPGVYSSKVVDYGITKVEERADTFYVIDISGSTVTSVVNEVKGRGFDSNYAGVYYPSVRVYDDVNKSIKTVPASVVALGAIAYNDKVAFPWFAPAGLNRAGLSRETVGFDITGIGAPGQGAPNQEDRDNLYEARINPITRFPGVPQGVIWGQKTLQLKESALDRINVRRLMIKAKKLVASAARFLTFDPANGVTMTRFKELVNPIFADIQQKQGVETFKVIMDETTSTPDLIDRNRLHGKIYLVPTRSAEIITVDFVVSPSGVTFEE